MGNIFQYLEDEINQLHEENKKLREQIKQLKQCNSHCYTDLTQEEIELAEKFLRELKFVC